MTEPAAPNRPETDRPDRDPETGRFVPGNRAAVTTGLDARSVPAEFEALLRETSEFLQAAIVDEGDPDVPRRRRSLLEYRARLHRRIVQLDAAIELRGLFDRKGKLRVSRRS